MPLDRFLIAPLQTGQQTDLKPFLIPDDAFEELRNAYVFRGRVKKRFGSFLMKPLTAVDTSIAQLSSRLRIKIGTTGAGGILTSTIPVVLPGVTSAIGQAFSIGTEFFTVYQAAGAMYSTTGVATTADFTVATGLYNFVGAATPVDVYFYPALPVMGLLTYEQPEINEELTYAFDTRFAYRYAAQGWERLGAGAVATWEGDDTEFFWGRNYRGATADATLLFVTNFNATETSKMRYWDGATWILFNPLIGAADTIETARIIVPFKDRLLLLNTVEKVGGANKSFVNRCRFCQNGSPVEVDAFRRDIAGKGGLVDIPTKEAIISVQLLKDRLIVFCERSTWELVFTGNNIVPFVYQQINSELGVESSFSIVPFDKVAIGVGNVGIHACNGISVDRVDQKIPNEVFKIHNDNDGILRVHGIRDYYTELVYWTFPSDRKEDHYPRHVLVYNYNNGSWAKNDDSITTMGYFQKDRDLRWEDLDMTWAEWDAAWNSAEFQSEFPSIIAGNQEGFTFILSPDEETRNAPALQITNIAVAGDTVTITSIDHNLQPDDYVLIENSIGTTGLNGLIKPVITVADDDTITLSIAGVAGTYAGGGTIARVSQIDILTKQYNFYNKQGNNLYIPIVDFLVDSTAAGAITVDYKASSSSRSLVDDASPVTGTGAILGTSVLETSPYGTVPLEASQDRFWHVLYPQAEGECIQLRLYLSPDQMETSVNSLGGFELNAILFHARSVRRQ